MPEVESHERKVDRDGRNKIITNGWKKLAKADQTDADELVGILCEVLEAIEVLDTQTDRESSPEKL